MCTCKGSLGKVDMLQNVVFAVFIIPLADTTRFSLMNSKSIRRSSYLRQKRSTKLRLIAHMHPSSPEDQKRVEKKDLPRAISVKMIGVVFSLIT